jgi:glycerophosphoryl diester phosphodiesterase
MLVGRAVLPVGTYAPGPPSGANRSAKDKTNGITFPTPSQPVEGFSAVVAGRQPGEYLGMPDNGFGAIDNSRDFLIRAYYLDIDFKTAAGGTGAVTVKDFISFHDAGRKIGFPIVNETTTERLLTGGDIDPESMQRAPNGDYWIGDEFGPWILHFDANGALLDPPYPVPGNLLAAELAGGLMSPQNPFRGSSIPTHPRSSGFEAMAITPDGSRLIAALEGATEADTDKSRRVLLEFSIASKAFTGRTWWYKTETGGYMVADMCALDEHRMVVIERDNGFGLEARFRSVYVVDLDKAGPEKWVDKRLAIDLTAIADPNFVSLPPIHAGDVGLGNPFRVTCESIEAIQVLSDERLLLGCDNNFPKDGRNPALADDTEFIIVKVPRLK